MKHIVPPTSNDAEVERKWYVVLYHVLVGGLIGLLLGLLAVLTFGVNDIFIRLFALFGMALGLRGNDYDIESFIIWLKNGK